MLDPNNSDAVAHLWRLARTIDTYNEDQKYPQLEPPPAQVASAELVHGSISVESPTPPGLPFNAEQTSPIDISNLEDGTMEIFISDTPPTEALDQEPPSVRTSKPRPSSAKGPPPPPPPIPKIRRRSSTPTPSQTHRTPKRTTLIPQGPKGPFSSPWAEFATAYAALPAKDIQSRLHWLFCAAEIWESGADDAERAFEILCVAMKLAPGNPDTRARLQHFARSHNKLHEVATLYQTAADNAESAKDAKELLLAIAEIYREQAKIGDVERVYRSILGIDPQHLMARQKLEDLYRTEKRWVDLAASLEERTNPRLGATDSPQERASLLRELATIYTKQLSRPHDAIEVLQRLTRLDGGDIQVLYELADLYCKIGRFSQATQALQRVLKATTNLDATHRALHDIANIYRDNLELPDRAIQTYEQIIAQWPDDSDAYQALDTLYTTQANWAGLENVLARRAALAQSQQERATLLHRRAQTLSDWQGKAEEAAHVLRQAHAIAPDRDDIVESLVQALVAAQCQREAVEILETRVKKLRSVKAGVGDLAAQKIHLATLRAENLGDLEAARADLEEALTLVPNHPTALAGLARLAEKSKDPRTYAQARLREAQGITDVDARIASFMLAGKVFQEKVGDVDEARKAFENVLQLCPHHSEATWALAGLVEQGGDPRSASSLLEERLQHETLEEREKTLILTQLAALARKAGFDELAERRLEEALQLKPDHIPAVIALTDLLSSAARHEDIRQLLDRIIPLLDEAPPASQAEVLRRLASSYEKLHQDDRAYQTLLTADRLDRGNLLVKLALGENRYRTRRWREAALHLGAVADYPDATSYPKQVANGLYHAALAEIRSLRPKNAPPLYERALTFKPDHGPSLQAMSELALQSGDNEKAHALLLRHANAASTPDEKVKRFEALGDLHRTNIGDRSSALSSYQQAVVAATPLESKHLPLLEKLLAEQEQIEDHLGIAQTAEQMGTFGTESRVRATRFKIAAENYLAAGETTKAREVAQRAIDDFPYDITAVTVLSNLLLDAGDYEQASAVLGRALSLESPEEDIPKPRITLLWHTLGRARLGRGDNKGAIAAFETSIRLAPQTEGAMASRRSLLDQWGDHPNDRDRAVKYRRTLALYSKSVDDIIALSNVLRDASNFEADTVLRVASLLGNTQSPVEDSNTPIRKSKVLAADEAYRDVLNQSDRTALIEDSDTPSPLATVLSIVWKSSSLLWSDLHESLHRCGITKATRVSASSTLVAASMFPRIAKVLDTPASVLYTSTADHDADVQAICAFPPVIVVGPRPQNIPASLTNAQLRFVLGRACEMARPERILACGLPYTDFTELVQSLIRCFGSPALRERLTITDNHEQDEKLRTALSVKLRRQIEQVLAPITDLNLLDPAIFAHSCQLAADRAGLLVCGDLEAAYHYLSDSDASEERLHNLLYTCLRPGFFPALAKLGLAKS